IKQTQADIEGYKQQLQQERERLLRQKFDARLDTAQKELKQMDAQENDMLKRLEENRTKLIDLARVQTQLKDLDTQVDNLTRVRIDNENKLLNLDAISALPSYYRVSILQPARIP